MKGRRRKPPEAAHVVLDAAAHVMRCNHCGQTEPLSIIEGRVLDFAIRIMDAFVDLHHGCPKNENGRPESRPPFAAG